MKPGKAAGPDSIPAVIYKNGGPALAECPLDLFQTIWRTEAIPNGLKDANYRDNFQKSR